VNAGINRWEQCDEGWELASFHRCADSSTRALGSREDAAREPHPAGADSGTFCGNGRRAYRGGTR
jgi:hypothetical protein